MSELISPNEALAKAKEASGIADPQTHDEWTIIVQTLALNIAPEVAESAILLFKRLYNIPLYDSEIEEIVRFQLAKQRARLN